MSIIKTLRKKTPRIIKEYWFGFKYLNYKPQFHQKYYIAMYDGRLRHGGLCDRLKGIISLYYCCKFKNIPFRIYWDSPFNLIDYLEPNKYNWFISKKDLPKSIWNVRVFHSIGDTSNRIYTFNSHKSLYYYGNRDLSITCKDYYINNPTWGETFKFLFKPSEKVNRNILYVKNLWNNVPYIALTFRFLNLLGDFNEFNSIAENEIYQKNLINKCIEIINNFSNQNKDKYILVTSDSKTFLHYASKIKKILIIPGEISHMDSSANIVSDQNLKLNELQSDVHLKTFVDFFLLSDAEKIYSIIVDKMYKSEFPYYASKINDIPFERLEYKLI